MRFVSVITDAEIAPDKMQKKELCIQCGRCVDNCPQRAFTKREGELVADMDKQRCAAYQQAYRQI